MSGSGTIRARSRGSWELRYQAAGRTKTETVRGNKRDAQRRLRELLTLVDQNRHPNDPDRLTLRAWLERWLGIIRTEVAAQTWINYEAAARVHIVPALGDRLLTRLAPGDLQNFYSTLGAGKLKASSARRACSILNTALSRAVELRLISANPADAVRKRTPRPDVPGPVAVLDHIQCAALLAAARESDLYAPVLIGLSTGMRRNEILALRWDDIDFAAKEIRVMHSIVHIRGETTRKAPKNGVARTITLPAEAMDELRQLKARQAEGLLHLGVRQTGSTEVCRRGEDGAILSPDSLSYAFGVLARRAGLSACTFHTLRHSHASELLRMGVAVHTAAARLGHKDGGALLLRTYAHVTDVAARDAADRIRGLFSEIL
jgi:integrase